MLNSTIEKYLERGKNFISEPDTFKLCSESDIPHPKYKFIQCIAECRNAAKVIGFPSVLKIVSPQIRKKSNIGGVILGINSAVELELEYKRLVKTVRANVGAIDIAGVLLQEEIEDGVDIDLIATWPQSSDPRPSIVIGAGKSPLDILKRGPLDSTPFDESAFYSQIIKSNTVKLLQDVFSHVTYSNHVIYKLFLNTYYMLIDMPGLTEIRFSPIRVLPDKCYVLDAALKIYN